MRDRSPDPRRRKVQMIAAAVVCLILVWSLLARDNSDLNQGQYILGWVMAAALALYAALAFWRRER